MKIDEQNGIVAYNDAAHSYWNVNDNEKYISATTLIELFAQKFDSDFWSKYKVLEKLVPKEFWKLESKGLRLTHVIPDTIYTTYNISKKDVETKQKELLAEWEQTNLESTTRGTKIHADLEKMIRGGGSNVSLKKYDIGGKFTYSGSSGPITAENGVYPEYLISRESPDHILRIAGHIDLLIKKGNKIQILDYKTNKEIKEKSGFDEQKKHNVMMHYPLSNLMDCNYSHYNLQLSLYAWMVCKQNPDLEVEDLVLVHFDHNEKMTIYHMPYLFDEVELMLKYYKREIIRNQQKQKKQRIEF